MGSHVQVKGRNRVKEAQADTEGLEQGK